MLRGVVCASSNGCADWSPPVGPLVRLQLICLRKPMACCKFFFKLSYKGRWQFAANAAELVDGCEAQIAMCAGSLTSNTKYSVSWTCMYGPCQACHSPVTDDLQIVPPHGLHCSSMKQLCCWHDVVHHTCGSYAFPVQVPFIFSSLALQEAALDGLIHNCAMSGIAVV